MVKLWAYKYKTVKEVSEVFDHTEVAFIPIIGALDSPPWSAPILYTDTDICYIYSDQEIDGLELVDTSVPYGGGELWE